MSFFSLQEDAGNGFAHNDAVVRKRIAKFEAAGAHREAIDVRTARARAFKPRYQEEVKVGPPANMRRAIPVNPESTRVTFPAYAAAGSAQVDEQKRQIMDPFTDDLTGLLLEQDNMSVNMLGRRMKTIPGFTAALRRAKCKTQKQVEKERLQ